MIKYKLNFTFLLLIYLAFNVGLKAQSIHLYYTNGTNASYSLQSVRKITFSADVMNLHLLDGTIYSWNVSSIDYYNYELTPLTVKEAIYKANALQVNVFPNPTQNNLQVDFILPVEDQVLLAIYDLQGKLLIQSMLGKLTKGEHHQNIDLNTLASGEYILRLNGQKISISKTIIKQ